MYLEIIAFSDRIAEFHQISCEILACSTDSHFSHLAWFVNHLKRQSHLILPLGLILIVNKVVLGK